MFRMVKAIALLICVFCIFHESATAQLSNLLPAKKTGSSMPTTAQDPLERTTPRSAIYKFLEACHSGKYAVAAQYLDLTKIGPQRRANEGPELAQSLQKLLDSNTRFEVGKLSDSPEGNSADGLSPNLENLATFELTGEPVNLYLEHVNQPSTGPIWLVSSESVAQIPELSSLIEQNGIEKHLPAPLVNIRLIGTQLWVWITLVLIAVILSAISRLLSRLFIAILKPTTKRYAKSFQTQRLEALAEPLRLLLSIMVFRATLAFIPTSALLRDDLLKLLILLFWLGAASLLMRLVDVVSDTVIARLDHGQRAITYSVFPLGIRFVKICIFCFAVLVIFQQWGFNISTILAGVGVGGIAVALAAQKTIENLFGGISLISDRPVLVGDFCQFGGQVGTVEDIGLRSTRIRTLDRTLVTVPNSQFSTMTLENYSKRDRMWFHPTIRLRRDTPPARVRGMMEAIQQILEKHESVDASGVPLRFSKISDQSLDLDIFAYVLTADSNEYLKVQSQLLLQILEASYKLGIGFAVPFQEEYNVSVDVNSESRHPYLAFQSRGIPPNADGAGTTPENAAVNR